VAGNAAEERGADAKNPVRDFGPRMFTRRDGQIIPLAHLPHFELFSGTVPVAYSTSRKGQDDGISTPS
jgi:hypothetical protein